MAGSPAAMEAPEKGGASAAMQSADAMQSGAMQPNAMQPNAAQPNAAKQPPQPLNIIQKTYRTEALARLQRSVIADCGFLERLVAFWSNHFCISANKGELARIWAGSVQREAVRPHVLGRVAAMLRGGAGA